MGKQPAYLVGVCEHDAASPNPVQQALLTASAKELAAKAVQLGAVQAGKGGMRLLGGAVVYQGCNVVLLQARFPKDQHSFPA